MYSGRLPADYAGKSIHEIFTPAELKDAVVRQVSSGNSSILVNEGGGQFKLRDLPRAAQMSPVFAIAVLDYDKDGKQDILLGGNFFDVLPELGRYDASYGLVLKEKGGGEFEPIMPKESGFFTTGQVREMAVIKRGGEDIIIVARNNDSALVFKVTARPSSAREITH